MDEDSNKKDANSSAKRSKLDNLGLDEEGSSTSNVDDVEMTEDPLNPGPVPNIDESNNKCGDISPPIEDSGYAENEKKEEGQEQTSKDPKNNTIESNEPGTSNRFYKPIRRTNRMGARRRNYRSRAILSSSDDSDDNFSPTVRRTSSSSSDSESNRNSGNNDDSASSGYSIGYPDFGVESEDSASVSSNRGNITPEVLRSKQKPDYNWNLIYEVMYREHGLSGKGKYSLIGRSPTAFQSRFYGARHIVEKMELLHCLEKHHGCVNSLHFNKTGNLLVSGSDDLKIILWNWSSNKIAYSFDSGHNANVFQTKFIEVNNGVSIVSSGRDGQVRHAVIPPSGSATSKILLKHIGPVHKIAPSPNNPYEILTAGEDGHVVRCDLRENSIERVVTVKVEKRKVPLYSIAHHPLDPEFCVCGRDQFVRVYDKRNVKKPVYSMCPKHLEEKKPFVSHITCAVYNSFGSEILASYSDESIYLFNNKNYIQGHHEHVYEGHSNNKTIKGVNFFGLNSEYVVSGSDCGNFFFWDKSTESIINWIEGDQAGVVNCLETHPSFPVLATSGLDHDVKIWVPFKEEFPPLMEGIEKCVKHNMKRSMIPDNDLFDDRTFFFFVRQCLRNRRSAQTDDNCPNVQDLVSSSSAEEDGCGPDDDNVQFRTLPCTPQ